ncbi:MAG TPA: OmpA family protein [Burkholderiales bacterium]|nr:OmpA family protein [Burkholderiales bacterium]
MNSALRITVAAVATCAALLPATGSAATAERKDGYLTDTQGGIVRAIGAGVCVRTSQWTPALAVAECDPDLIPKPAPPAPKPAPAPKPEAKPEPKPEAKPKPAKPQMMNVERKIELQGMPFDKAEMTPDNVKELDEFLADLKPVTLGALIVTGHTDRIGSLKYNQRLSERRAVVVKDYIVSKGIDPKLIFWEGKAFKQPIPVTKFCSNKMKRKQLIECLAPNRRVTVEAVGVMPAPAKKPAAKPEAGKPEAGKPEAKPAAKP